MNTTYECLFTEAIQLGFYSELKKKYNLSDDQRLKKHFEWREKKSASTPPSAQYALLWWEQDALSKDKPKVSGSMMLSYEEKQEKGIQLRIEGIRKVLLATDGLKLNDELIKCVEDAVREEGIAYVNVKNWFDRKPPVQKLSKILFQKIIDTYQKIKLNKNCN